MTHLSVELVQQDILTTRADACVCTIHSSKNLEYGILSKQFLQAGGHKLQRNVFQKSPQESLSPGMVIGTPAEEGLSKSFKSIYFVCLRSWQDSIDALYLQGAIEDILNRANKRKFTSLILPPIGTGNLGYPPKEVVVAIVQGIMAYGIDHPDCTVKDVKISLFKQADEMLEAFATVLLHSMRVHNPSTTMPESRDTATSKEAGFYAKADTLMQGGPNLLGKLKSFFGWPMPKYRFLLYAVPMYVSPHIGFERRGAGAAFCIGITIGVDVLPSVVKKLLVAVFGY